MLFKKRSGSIIISAELHDRIRRTYAPIIQDEGEVGQVRRAKSEPLYRHERPVTKNPCGTACQSKFSTAILEKSVGFF